MFSNAVRLFDIAGFQLRVDPSWLIIAALIVWSLATGYFPAEVPGLHRTDYLALATVAMLGLFVGLILHELAHSLVARRFGLGVGGITLFLFGGVAELQQEPESPGSEFWIAIAGPVMSVALAAAFAVAGRAAEAAGRVWRARRARRLPRRDQPPPRALQPPARLPARRGPGAARRALAGEGRSPVRHAHGDPRGARLRLRPRPPRPPRPVLDPVGAGRALAHPRGPLPCRGGRATWQQMLTQRALRGRTVGQLMTRAVHTTGPERTVQDLVDEVMLQHGVGFVPVIENGQALGYVDTGTVRGIDRDNWDATRVEDVFVALAPEMQATPDEPLERLLQRISDTGRRKFVVTEGRRFVGVVTLSDLVAHIGVLRDLSAADRPRCRTVPFDAPGAA
jgi:CBS domain-containing protein